MSTQYSVSLSLQVQQAIQSMKQLVTQFTKFDKEVDDAEKSLDGFERGLAVLSNRYKDTIAGQTAYIKKLQSLQANLDKTSPKFKRIQLEIERTNQKLKAGSASFNGFVAAAAGLGIGFGAQRLITELSQVGVALNQAEGAVKTLAKDSFPEVSEAIKQTVRESDGLTNVIEANEAAYQLLSAGISGAADVSSVLDASIKLSKAGFTDTTTAVDGLTTVINAYGFDAARAAKLTDQFVQTQNDGKIVIGEYARNIGKVAPIASSLGVSLEEVNAALALSTVQGSQAEVAATGLRSALAKLAAPTEEGKKILSQYGATLNASTIESKGLEGALQELSKITSKEDLLKLVGTEAGTTIQQLLKDLPRLNQLIENQQKASGTAERAIDDLSGSYKDVADRLANLQKDLKAQAFKDLEGVFKLFARVVFSLVKAFNALPGPIRKTITVVSALTLGILALGVGALVAASGIMFLKGQLLAMTNTLTLSAAVSAIATGAMTALGTAITFITGPVGLTVLAIAALVAGLVLAYKNIEPFRNAVDATVDVVVRAAKAIAAFFAEFGGALFNNAKKEWNDLVGFLGKAWDQLVNEIQFAWKQVTEGIKIAIESVRTFVLGVIGAIQSAWALWTGTLSALWTELTTRIYNRFKTQIDAIKGVFDQFKRFFGSVIDKLKGLWFSLLNALGSTWIERLSKIIAFTLRVLNPVGFLLEKIFGVNIEKSIGKALQKALNGFGALRSAVERGGKAAADAFNKSIDETKTADPNEKVKDKTKPPVTQTETKTDTDTKQSADDAKKAADLAKRLADDLFKNNQKNSLARFEFEQTLRQKLFEQSKDLYEKEIEIYKNGLTDAQKEILALSDGLRLDDIDSEINQIRDASEKAKFELEQLRAAKERAGDPLALQQATNAVQEQQQAVARLKAEESALLIQRQALAALNGQLFSSNLAKLYEDEIAAIEASNDALEIKLKLEAEGVDSGYLEMVEQLNEFEQVHAERLGIINALLDAQVQLLGESEKGSTAYIDAARNAEILRNELTAVEKQADRTRDAIQRAADLKALDADPIRRYAIELKTELEDTKSKITDMVATLEDGLTSAFNEVVDGVIAGNANIAESFSKMFAQIGKDYIAMATKMIAKALILKALQALGIPIGVVPTPQTGGSPGGGGGGGGAFGIGAAAASGGSSGASSNAFSSAQNFAQPFFSDAATDYFGQASDSLVSNQETMLTNFQTDRTDLFYGETADGGGLFNSSPLDIRYESVVINETQYVTAEEFERGVMGATKQAQANTMRDLRNRPAQRKKAGVA